MIMAMLCAQVLAPFSASFLGPSERTAMYFSCQDQHLEVKENTKNEKTKKDEICTAKWLAFVKRKIPINEARVEELLALPGVGKKTAEKIVYFRNQAGKITNESDLKKIPGIGEANAKKFLESLSFENSDEH